MSSTCRVVSTSTRRAARWRSSVRFRRLSNVRAIPTVASAKFRYSDDAMRTRCAYNCAHAFPEYAQGRQKCVDERFLQLAIMRATWHFAFNLDEYKRVFRNYAKRHLRCKPSAVKFDPMSASLRRIRSAVLVDGDDFYGWTDGNTIHISRDVPMGFDQLVGTLLHEELHCFCKARGRFLGAETDHHCMRVLGDDC